MNARNATNTPGPWMTDGSGPDAMPWTVHAVSTTWAELEKSPSNGMIAECSDVNGELATRIANARLIKSAPDLLAFARVFAGEAPGMIDGLPVNSQIARQLIAFRDAARAVVESATGVPQ